MDSHQASEQTTMTKEDQTEYELGSTNLFKPIKVGNVELKNRTFFAPSTRLRATLDADPTDLMVQYYDDRSKDNGGLIITEATFISPNASGMAHAPGIWTDKQTNGWKKIVDKVHANGTAISMQLWNLGRSADPAELKRLGCSYVSSSPKYIDESYEKKALEVENPLRALTLKEIEIMKQQYVRAAVNAIKVAGFDFVELHNAHGYLLDQFLLPSVNTRADKYGGSIENRARLTLEIVDLLIEEVGAEHVGIRLSAWTTFAGALGANEPVHPIATHSYLLNQLNKRKIAYVSIVELRVSSSVIEFELDPTADSHANDFVYQLFDGPVLRAGNYLSDRLGNYPRLREHVNANDRTLIGFSRHFTSNPDLPNRLKNGWDLTQYDRPHFYTNDNEGYNVWGAYGEDKIVDKSVVTKKPTPL